MGAEDIGCDLFLPLCLDINYSDVIQDNIISTLTPQIFWTYFDTAGTAQNAFEIEVGTDDDWNIAEMWASGQINSADTSVIYDGSVLAENAIYYLRVRLFNGTEWGKWALSSFVTHVSNTINVPAEMLTIQSALDYALEGDSVIVADGIYSGEGNVNLSFNGKNLILKSENGSEFTIIDCQNDSNNTRGIIFENGETSASIVDGFTIQNGAINGGGGGIYIISSSPEIRNCTFSNNQAIGSGSYGGGINCSENSSAQIFNCKFIGNSAPNGRGGGLYNSRSDLIMEGCLFWENSANECGGAFIGLRSIAEITNCLFAKDSAYSGRASTFYVSSSTANITNCSFVDNRTRDALAALNFSHSTVTLENSIIAFSKNSLGVFREFGGSLSVSCTNIFGNEDGDWINDLEEFSNVYNNMSLDPMFCDTTAGDYHISYNSPCSPILNSCGLIGSMEAGCSNEPLPIAANIQYSGSLTGQPVFTLVPEITWEYLDTSNTSQAAYEIEIGTDDDWTAPEMWATGSVYSSESYALYDGIPLDDFTNYYMRIRVNDGVDWGEWIQSWFYTRTSATIRVPADLTTIQDAIGFAINQDTVLVADGIYSGDGNRDICFYGKNIVVKSENGPQNCVIDCQGDDREPHRAFVFRLNEDTTSIVDGFTMMNGYGLLEYGYNRGGAILCNGASPSIKNCNFIYNVGSRQGGGISYLSAGRPTLTNCTFTNNRADYGSAVYFQGEYLTVDNCIMTYNLEGAAVEGSADWGLKMSCCDVYSNEGGDWYGLITGQFDVRGNISEDPLFCNLLGNDYNISSSSPCAPAHTECGQIMGAGAVSSCGNYAVISIDRSGSMFYTDPAGFSRLQRAKELAHQDVDKLLDYDDLQFPESYFVAVQYFNASGIVLQQDFTYDATALHDAIDAIPGPKHDTPLAAAMCQAHCRVLDQDEFTSSLVFTYTDGLENESQNFDMCTLCEPCNDLIESGWNFDCDPTDPGSCTEWQLCLNGQFISTGINIVHYFGEPINPFDKSKNYDGLEDMYFLKSAAEGSSGGFIYHSDQIINGYVCGDANQDYNVNVADAIYIINFVFSGGDAPIPYEAGNVNCDSYVNVSDAVYIINYVFTGGTAPCDCGGR